MSSSPSRENPGTQPPSPLWKNSRVLRPSEDDPEETKNQVKLISKKHPNPDVAAGDLAPIFGLGEGLLAKQRAQALFNHPEFLTAFRDFDNNYIRRKWDLPLGEWVEVRELVREGMGWASGESRRRDVNYYYARFVMQTLRGINQSGKSPTQLAYWLRDGELCDQTWVLMHALMYFQLRAMREFKRMAPLKDRITRVMRKS
ncbi:hypothetical protein GGS26DRAFT_187720 [Hypomontagnella submonticulosa]|nr:hypothetical protein GGS26DRAFT_187720 [Hypomontagnella submonticulosa]